METDGDLPLVLAAFGPVGRNAGKFPLEVLAAFGLGLLELLLEPRHPLAHLSKLGQLVKGFLAEDQVATPSPFEATVSRLAAAPIFRRESDRTALPLSSQVADPPSSLFWRRRHLH